MPRIVVPDTNALYGDLRMRRRNFRVLLAEHGRGNLVLAVPEIVLGELPKRFREQFVDARHRTQTGLTNLGHLGVDPGPLTVPAISTAEASYMKELRGYLQEHGVRTPALPDIGTRELYEQAVAEKRPFQAAGKGFKDALIWHTVRELAKSEEVVLITRNHTDFAESAANRDSLHADLIEDVVADGHAPDRVTMLPDVDAFIARYVSSTALYMEQAQTHIRRAGPWLDDLRALLYEALVGMDTRGDYVTVVDSQNAFVDVNYVEAAAVGEIEVVETYETGDDDVVSLELVVHANVQFNFTADRQATEWLVAERTNVQLDVLEETFAQGHTLGAPVSVRFALDYNVKTGEVGEPEKLFAEDDTTAKAEG